MQRNKIAIACQGGGSQTAFTAGVLKSFFMNGVHMQKEIVGLSGTSGGAVCAALAWYSLIKARQGDSTPIEQRLMNFWDDIAAQNIYEKLGNDFMVNSLYYIDKGLLPRWEISPGSFFSKSMLQFSSMLLPRRNFYDFKNLLETHINFDEIRSWGNVSNPALLLGAANVLTGEFKKFSSIKGEIQVEALLASAAIPSVFPAVKIDENAYWDGLFADNPPTEDLLGFDMVGPEYIPDELWIIQIDPRTCQTVPDTSQDIINRRAEMIGNVSLYQDLEKINLINRLLEQGAFTEEFLNKRRYKPIEIHIISKSPEVQASLDYTSYLNRDKGFIKCLIADGEKQGKEFLESLLSAPF